MQYNKNLLTAIIVCEIPHEKPVFRKYRNIKNTDYWLRKTEAFARTIPFAHHINFYHKKNREFFKRINL